MKFTSVAVLALVFANTLAQPIVLLKDQNLDTRAISPTEIADLEARKIHINWHKVGDFFKKVKNVLFKRNNDGDLILVARDLVDHDGELLGRDFDDMLEVRDFEDDYLEARDVDDMLEARDFDDKYLEARDFDDEYLEARDFDDDYLEARDFDDNYLEARDFDDDYLEARGFDDKYLEARDYDEDLEARFLQDVVANTAQRMNTIATQFPANHPRLSTAANTVVQKVSSRVSNLRARDFNQNHPRGLSSFVPQRVSTAAAQFSENHPRLNTVVQKVSSQVSNLRARDFNQHHPRGLSSFVPQRVSTATAQFSEDHPRLSKVGHLAKKTSGTAAGILTSHSVLGKSSVVKTAGMVAKFLK